jgi:hypothetical protein
MKVYILVHRMQQMTSDKDTGKKDELDLTGENVKNIIRQ